MKFHFKSAKLREVVHAEQQKYLIEKDFDFQHFKAIKINFWSVTDTWKLNKQEK